MTMNILSVHNYSPLKIGCKTTLNARQVVNDHRSVRLSPNLINSLLGAKNVFPSVGKPRRVFLKSLSLDNFYGMDFVF